MRLCLAGVLTLAGCLDLGSDPWQAPAAFQGAPATVPPQDTITTADGGVSAGDSHGDMPPEGPAPIVCPHADGAPAQTEVRMVSNHFQPADVAICAGDRVNWTNEDTKEHTIYTGWPGKPDGAVQSPKIYYGKSWSFIFKTPGEFIYFCSTHKKKMQGALVAVH